MGVLQEFCRDLDLVILLTNPSRPLGMHVLIIYFRLTVDVERITSRGNRSFASTFQVMFLPSSIAVC